MLSAIGYKVKGVPYADLSWVGATGAEVDVYRNGVFVTTIDNDGFYTDQPAKKGGGSFTHKVCESGTNVCSNEVTVVI
jgi:hypothetical protein